MTVAREFWQRLFTEGRIVMDGPPGEQESITTLLEERHTDHLLTVAGPPVPFDPETAARAARLVHWAAWYLVSRAGTQVDLERNLVLASPQAGAAQHLSADLVLQYLPSIYHRARAVNPGDGLSVILAEILRRWPLSGVLADVPDGSLGDLDFGGHPGLLLLYAERLAENFKPGWIPRGLGAPYLELVWSELGKDPALLLPLTPSANVVE
jgi:hypothetical protein